MFNIQFSGQNDRKLLPVNLIINIFVFNWKNMYLLLFFSKFYNNDEREIV
jgi:hypothetical protein